MGILLMYDVTNLESYNNLSYWLRNIQENASPDVVKVLAGNKCECSATQRMVDKERGEKVSDCRKCSIDTNNTILCSLQIAENFDMPFFEVSCKSNINIEDAFLSLARKIREQRERRVRCFKITQYLIGKSFTFLPGGQLW